MLSLEEKLATSQVKPRGLLGNIWAHDVAERMRIRRKSIADQSGMPDDWDVGTYPPYVMHKSGWVQGALLAAALAAGAAGAWWLAQQSMSQSVSETIIEREIAVGIEVIPPTEPVE